MTTDTPRTQLISYCDECDSPFFADTSPMTNVCPNCNHLLYGYPNCEHQFMNGLCEKCGWNGKTSLYCQEMIHIKPVTHNPL